MSPDSLALAPASGLTSQALLDRFGSPLFVFDAQRLRDNVRLVQEAFAAAYPRVRVAYAVKVNPLGGVLATLRAAGAGMEVASGLEYALVRRLGVPGPEIVFNGPYKTRDELARAGAEGALVNVDHDDELARLATVARARGQPQPFGLRVSVDVGVAQAPDRFGFDVASGQALAAARQAAADGGLRLIGLHAHVGSYVRRPEPAPGPRAHSFGLIWPKGPELFARLATGLVDFARTLHRELALTLDYLDVGGGLPPAREVGPFVAPIAEPLRALAREQGTPPELILEPGRALVHDAGSLLTRVVGTKSLADGQAAVVLDAGVHLLPTALWRTFALRPLAPARGPTRPTAVYGPLCLQTDLLAETADLPPLRPGDALAIADVGAYNWAQSTAFIFARPAVVMVDGDQVSLLRRAEDLDSLLALEPGGEGRSSQ